MPQQPREDYYQHGRTEKKRRLRELLHAVSKLFDGDSHGSHYSAIITKHKDLLDEIQLTDSDFNNFQRLFEQIDTDKSGKVSITEAITGLKGFGLILTEREMQEMIADGDENEDGELDFDEFVTLLVQNWHILGTAKSRRADSRPTLVESLEVKAYMPDSTFRWAWDVAQLFSIEYYCMQTCMWLLYGILGRPPHWAWSTYSIIDICLFIMGIVNVFLKSRTAYLDQRNHLIVDLRKIRRHYIHCLTHGLLVDLVSILPLDTILRAADVPVAIYTGFACLRFLSILRVPYLFASSGRDYMVNAVYIRFMFYVVPILKLLFYSILVIHALTIIAMACGIGLPAPTLECPAMEVIEVLEATGTPIPTPTPTMTPTMEMVAELLYDPSTYANYLDSLYWVFYTISTCGYGDVPVNGNARIYACILFLLTVLINGTVIGKIGELVRVKSIDDDANNRMRDTLTLMNTFFVDMPQDLKTEIFAFQHHFKKSHLPKNQADVIDSMPQCLQQRLGEYVMVALISVHPLLAEATLECRMALAQKLVVKVTPPSEFICLAGEEGKEMFFLSHGFAELLSPDGLPSDIVLRPGDFFGLDTMDRLSQITRSARCLTFCEIFVLSKADLKDILRRFPRFAASFIETSNNTRAKTRHIANAEDADPDATPRVGHGVKGSAHDKASTLVDPKNMEKGGFLSNVLKAYHTHQVLAKTGWFNPADPTPNGEQSKAAMKLLHRDMYSLKSDIHTLTKLIMKNIRHGGKTQSGHYQLEPQNSMHSSNHASDSISPSFGLGASGTVANEAEMETIREDLRMLKHTYDGLESFVEERLGSLEVDLTRLSVAMQSIISHGSTLSNLSLGNDKR